MHAEFPELAPGKGFVAFCDGVSSLVWFSLLVLRSWLCLESRSAVAADKPSSPKTQNLYFLRGAAIRS